MSKNVIESKRVEHDTINSIKRGIFTQVRDTLKFYNRFDLLYYSFLGVNVLTKSTTPEKNVTVNLNYSSELVETHVSRLLPRL